MSRFSVLYINDASSRFTGVGRGERFHVAFPGSVVEFDLSEGEAKWTCNLAI